MCKFYDLHFLVFTAMLIVDSLGRGSIDNTKYWFSLITSANIFTYLIIFNVVLERSVAERAAYGEGCFMRTTFM